MRWEYVDNHSQANHLAHIGVPFWVEIIVFSVEYWDEAQKLLLASISSSRDKVKVDDEDHQTDVDKLQQSQLLELPLGLISFGVVLLNFDTQGEYQSGNDIDDHNNQRRANHWRLLQGVIEQPVFAVKCLIRHHCVWSLVQDFEFGEWDVNDGRLFVYEIFKAVTMH